MLTVNETLTIVRMRQWMYDRAALRAGRTVNLLREGFTPRDQRHADARSVRVLDFERAFGLLPPRARALLVLRFVERTERKSLAEMFDTCERTNQTHTKEALSMLADILDRRGLL